MVRILAFQARGPGSIPGRRSASGGLAQSEERYVSNVQAPRSKLGFSILLRVIGAAIAQLGERQTEDLKVPGSIPGGGNMLMVPVAQRTRRETTNLKIAGSNPVGDKHYRTAWPSGLRRQVKVLISSGARVRIPSQSNISFYVIRKRIMTMCVR